MTTYILDLRSMCLILLTGIASLVTAQLNPAPEVKSGMELFNFPIASPNAQIAEYIRNIFEDKNGGLWFGTNGKGVAHFDGTEVHYYSIAQGFGGEQVTGITEDLEDNLWFATNLGVVKCEVGQGLADSPTFTNFTDKAYFENRQFWSVYADSKGTIWAGCSSAIYRFDGASWSAFSLPYPEQQDGTFITSSTTWGITEDAAGNMWFSTNGFGAFRWDGQNFQRFTAKDGLAGDHVDQILVARNNDVWFGTRHGGVSRLRDGKYMNFTSRDRIGNNEVCIVYEDSAGHIWFSSEGFGVYRYDGNSLTNYAEAEGLGVRAVQTIYEDRQGRLWAGGGGGLYRKIGERFVHIGKFGRWD